MAQDLVFSLTQDLAGSNNKLGFNIKNIAQTKMKKPPKERFESKYAINLETGCWDWLAYTDHDGHGTFWTGERMFRAHRFSYELYRGKIPVGLQALHICVGNPGCVNPEHLYLGLDRDNTKDRVDQNRQARQKGVAHGRAKLTELQVLQLREHYAMGKYSQRDLAKMFEISPVTVCYIVTRKLWRHI